MKISSPEVDIAKMERNRDSPLNVGPLGEVLLKFGEIDWHFRLGWMKWMKMQIAKFSRCLIVITLG